MKSDKVLWIVLLLLIATAFISPFLPSFESVEKYYNNVRGKEFIDSKINFEKYKIDVSEGETEIERTLIIKLNNVINLLCEASEKGQNTNEDKYNWFIANEDFSFFLRKNERNISSSLLKRIEDNVLKLSKDIDKHYPEKEVGNDKQTKKKYPKVKEETVRIEPLIVNEERYTEEEADLNDYFNSSTGWDDETDWNYTGFEDEESQIAFDKVLKRNGIYWSDKKQSWVIKKNKSIRL